MELLPEWAPNLHPLVVHFPIAFILGAIGADLISLLIPRWDWLRSSTIVLYFIAGASAVVTYFTGTWAADTVSVSAEVQSLLTDHSDLGWWTMWFFGVYGLVRLGLHLWPGLRDRGGLHTFLFLIALGGGYLLYETGEHGAEMVYRYGVGVQEIDATVVSAEPGITIESGGWQWRPQSDTAWAARMTWWEGRPTDVQTALDTTGTGAVVLRIEPTSPVTFVVPDTLEAVQVTAELNLDDFEGMVSLLHHGQDGQNYDFLAVGDGTVWQGRVSDGERTVSEEAAVDFKGWQTIRAVGDGTHFRGYVGKDLVTHPHGEAASPGTVGLHLEGKGYVFLRRLSAETL